MSRAIKDGIEAYLGLGSNLGDRAAHIETAVTTLDRHPDIAVLDAASLYESEAHTLEPSDTAPPFINTVIRVKTRLGPHELLDAIEQTEAAAGRSRGHGARWEPRTLDIDIIAFDDVRLSSERLTLPHPRISQRRFVLAPLAEIAPRLMLPAPYSHTAADLLARCADPGEVKRVGRLERRDGGFSAVISDEPQHD